MELRVSAGTYSGTLVDSTDSSDTRARFVGDSIMDREVWCLVVAGLW